MGVSYTLLFALLLDLSPGPFHSVPSLHVLDAAETKDDNVFEQRTDCDLGHFVSLPRG